MSETAGLPARRAALKLIDAVLRRGETLEKAEFAAMRGVDAPADKALARAIAAEALRWMADIDTLIDSCTSQPLPADAKARMVLRLMLAQWLRLQTPPHAVVATGLELLDGGPRRLAHGVFATLTRRKASLPPLPALPNRALHRWGPQAASIGAGLAEPPPLDLALRDFAATQDWAQRLGGFSLAPGHVRLPRGSAIESLPGFADGAWWVQDLAASLPARLLGRGEGRTALDLAAAPGGKTLQLAAASWDVTAVDVSAKRLQLLRANLARTKLSAKVITANALQWRPAEQFDAILIDAPCTATGTCRRHPDVLHRIGPKMIGEMAEIQAAMLERASDWLKPGGQLVYAVCSLEREEGEDIAATCSLDPQPIRQDELPPGLEPTAQGWLRTDPSMLADQGGLDGFFVARWVKPA